MAVDFDSVLAVAVVVDQCSFDLAIVVVDWLPDYLSCSSLPLHLHSSYSAPSEWLKSSSPVDMSMSLIYIQCFTKYS